MHPLRRIVATYVTPHLWSYLAGFGFIAVTNWLTVEVPMRIGLAIDAYASGGGVQGHLLAVALMGLAVIVVRTLSRVLIFNPARSVEYSLRVDLFGRLLQHQPSFYGGRSTGDIISRASNDITFARVFVGFGLMQAVNVTVALGLTAWKMLALSPWLTLLAVVPIALSMVLARTGIGRIFHLHRVGQEQLGSLSDHVLASFQGISTIQGFVAEDRFVDRFDERNEALLDTRVKAAFLASVAFPALSLGGSLAVFVLLFVGGPMAASGELSVGQIAAFLTLLGILLPPLRSMGWMISIFQRGQVSLERIFELLDAPVERPEGDTPLDVPQGAPAISLRDLHFAYPDAPDEEVLKGVTVDIAAGSVVGVFGRTGSGKSTLIRLLSRLYNPPAGAVFVGSTDAPVDLCSVDLVQWRAGLSIAPQRAFLFSDTIGQNVELAAQVTADEVDRNLPGSALDRSRRDRVVDLAALAPDLQSLPSGVDTVVGERGIMLSGGQRQRVALARALYKGSSLLLLDDVLSAVDHTTESRLVESLSGSGVLDSRPTTLIVSHRVSAFRGTDLIIVLDEGRLVAQGTHEQLVAEEGPYRDAWLAQRPTGAEAP